MSNILDAFIKQVCDDFFADPETSDLYLAISELGYEKSYDTAASLLDPKIVLDLLNDGEVARISDPRDKIVKALKNRLFTIFAVTRLAKTFIEGPELSFKVGKGIGNTCYITKRQSKGFYSGAGGNGIFFMPASFRIAVLLTVTDFDPAKQHLVGDIWIQAHDDISTNTLYNPSITITFRNLGLGKASKTDPKALSSMNKVTFLDAIKEAIKKYFE